MSLLCYLLKKWSLKHNCYFINFLNLQFIEKFHEVKEATRTATKPNGTTPTTSASASPVASRAVNKSAGGNVGVTTGGTTNVDYPPNGGTVGSGISTLTTNDQNVTGVNVVTHDYNSQQPQQPPPQNQNEINVNNSNVLKAQVAPHQRSQSLSGMQPVNISNYCFTNMMSIMTIIS